MKNPVLKYGLIAGIILSVYLLIAMQFMSEDTEMSTAENLGNTIMFLILGGTMFYGLKKYRDEDLGGYISYGNVFVKGLLITLLSGVIYSLTWTIGTQMMDMDFSEMYKNMTLKEMQSSGASDEEISIVLEQIEAFMPYYNMPAVKFFIAILEPLMPGVLAALILGFILKRNNTTIESAGTESAESN